jgi:hypothetical protein
MTVSTRALHWSQSWARSIHSIPLHPISKLHFNIIVPSRSSDLSLSFWFSHQNPICIPLLSHACYLPYPSHPPWLDHSNYTWRKEQVMKLLIIQPLIKFNFRCSLTVNMVKIKLNDGVANVLKNKKRRISTGIIFLHCFAVVDYV